MLFKLYPWEFGDKKISLLNKSESGYLLNSLLAVDAYAQKFIMDDIAPSNNEIFYAEELTLDWFESRFMELSLFSSTSVTVIYRAQNLSAKVSDFIFENLALFRDEGLILVFSKKNQVYEKLSKDDLCITYEVMVPRFWEFQKYILFLAKSLGIDISTADCAYLSDSLPTSSGTIVNVLNQLKLLELPFSMPMAEKLRACRFSGSIDRFAVAGHFNKGEIHLLWKKILDIEIDYDELRGLFSFMQTHVFKTLNNNYHNSKKKLSLYDKGVLLAQKNWENSQLKDFYRLFSKLEISSKRKDFLIKQELRLYLNNSTNQA